MPVPLTEMVWALVVALVATLMAAVSVAVVVGVKVAEMVQLEPAERVAAHVVVSEKLVAFVPPRAMEIAVRVEPPGFESVTLMAVAVPPRAVPGKAMVVVESTACAGVGGVDAAVPVPVRVIVWGVEVALLATLRVAV